MGPDSHLEYIVKMSQLSKKHRRVIYTGASESFSSAVYTVHIYRIVLSKEDK